MEVGAAKSPEEPRHELKGDYHAELDGGSRAELPGDFGSYNK